MARNFDSIKDIDGTQETLHLVIRIIDLWVVPTRDYSGHLEMVIMDSNGDKILFMARKDQFDTWYAMLREGSTYIMNNFRTVPNDGQYKICNHALKLLFTGETTLKTQDLLDITNNVYGFMNFEDILTKRAKFRCVNW
ncbi:hypothetical protein AAZX31_12G102300 [Glycine max]|nr:hypothetical protein JHK85_034108 [Glycine max]KAG5118967.1 hypothetical protein JHK82_033387 [Glycine max]KAG5139960.1 hypothetical protein JHK84_033728 [Glycine max]KHN22906.1 hypothetical protein glysoja_020836 [Glycine soja]